MTISKSIYFQLMITCALGIVALAALTHIHMMLHLISGPVLLRTILGGSTIVLAWRWKLERDRAKRNRKRAIAYSRYLYGCNRIEQMDGLVDYLMLEGNSLAAQMVSKRLLELAESHAARA